jgi:hypothetical protein
MPPTVKEYAVTASKAQNPGWQTRGVTMDGSYVNEDVMGSPTEKKDASRGSTLLTIPFIFKVNGVASVEVAPPTSITTHTTPVTKWRVARSSAFE